MSGEALTDYLSPMQGKLAPEIPYRELLDALPFRGSIFAAGLQRRLGFCCERRAWSAPFSGGFERSPRRYRALWQPQTIARPWTPIARRQVPGALADHVPRTCWN